MSGRSDPGGGLIMRNCIKAFAGAIGILAGAAAMAGEASLVPLASPASQAGQQTDACRASKAGSAGGAVRWSVVRAAGSGTGAIVAETSREAVDPKYPVCLFDKFRAEDLEISVDLTPREGEIDRAGGLIVRARNENDFYVVRSNALENNVRLYHSVKGQRRQFAGASHNLFSGRTHRLMLRVIGDVFTVSVDGKKLFEGRDAAIPKAGAIGLWSKADSVTEFSNLSVTVLKE